VQEESIITYFKIDTDEKQTCKRLFGIFGTGHDCTKAKDLKFVGTVKLQEHLIFHIFIKPEEADGN